MSASRKVLEQKLAELLAIGEGKPEDIASKMADAIDEYVQTLIKNELLFYIPSGTVVTQVTGQAVGVPNPNPIKVEVK